MGVALLLAIEGNALLVLLMGAALDRWTRWSLALPIAALLNAILFFLFLILGIPLRSSTVFPAHGLMVLGLSVAAWNVGSAIRENKKERSYLPLLRSSGARALVIVLLFLVTVKLLGAIMHTAVLPTFSYDALMEWNMRAKTSFFHGAIAMVGDMYRGATPQPQFPILFHALQILFMLPHGRWIDQMSNSATLLLCVTSFFALFFTMRQSGMLLGLLAVWSVLAIPLVTVQLEQGYADLHVALYLLLSALFLQHFLEARDPRLLLLSGLLCAGAAWTKQEGFFFGVLPWTLLVAGLSLKEKTHRRRALLSVLPGLLLGALWTAFLMLRRMPIGPHENDFTIAWHPEGLPQLFRALFAMGSFGIHWYVVLSLIPLSICMATRRERSLVTIPLVWGGIMMAELFVVFLFTPNVRFLLSHQTFHRTALLPLTMLTLTGVLLVRNVWEQQRMNRETVNALGKE